MKLTYYLTRPTSLEIFAVLVVGIAFLIARHDKLSQNTPVCVVLRAQQAAAKMCAPHDRLLMLPYARQLARIDATACPYDFYQAWQKYVGDIQMLSAIQRAEAGKSMLAVASAALSENPLPLLEAMPGHPEQGEIWLSIAVADWQNVKQVALRHGIKIPPTEFSEHREA